MTWIRLWMILILEVPSVPVWSVGQRWTPLSRPQSTSPRPHGDLWRRLLQDLLPWWRPVHWLAYPSPSPNRSQRTCSSSQSGEGIPEQWKNTGFWGKSFYFHITWVHRQNHLSQFMSNGRQFFVTDEEYQLTKNHDLVIWNMFWDIG